MTAFLTFSPQQMVRAKHSAQTVTGAFIASPERAPLGIGVPALIDHTVPDTTTNDSGSFRFDETTREVAENMPVGTNVGDPVVADRADFTYKLTYSMGGEDASCFDIDEKNGQITTYAVMDYEARSVFNVLVKVGDGDEGIGAARIVIYIINEDEDGRALVIPDRPDVGWPVTAILTDPDGGASEVQWQWLLGKSAQGTFDPIDGADSDSYTPQSGDTGMYLKALASYSDDQRSNKTAEVASQDVIGPDLDAPDACSVQDHPDHLGTSLVVDPGQTIEGGFCSQTDGDWIGMNMAAGQAYAIAINWSGGADRG